MKMKMTAGMLGMLALTVIISCSKSSDDPDPGGGSGGNNECPTETPKFSTSISSIISSSCTASSCHGAGSLNGPGPLLTYDQIYAARTAIRQAVVSKTMPKEGSLSNAQILAISCWVQAGAPNN
ncbi:hypothetical protein [Flavihumibacter sp. ZG627]|uniref:hypothetical protein n=1 Tax=Flavihumibacter sp. ZG627 TaxID=1463156 RepID=UPI000693513B|nr:hypothetical protein [Flavihumibacter sp. ZG627]